MKWTNDGTVLLYDIYRANDETSEGTLCAIMPASSPGYSNINLESGKTYYYYVVGYQFVDGKLKPVNTSARQKITVK